MPELTDWVIFGLLGQLLFSLRFLVQWIASEIRKQSVIPVSFWIFSLLGASVLLAYAIHKRDPVFILGQSAGFFIYTRNLVLVRRRRAERHRA
jgi:lipid-A-disaccharide synthase-like uncharacterized protein